MKETSLFYPVRMHPAFRSGRLTPWGGERLRTVWESHHGSADGRESGSELHPGA